MREILSLAQRKNLLRYTMDPAPDRSVIEIFPTLKRIIPFQNIDEWNKNAERYLAAVRDPQADADPLADEDDGGKSE